MVPSPNRGAHEGGDGLNTVLAPLRPLREGCEARREAFQLPPRVLAMPGGKTPPQTRASFFLLFCLLPLTCGQKSYGRRGQRKLGSQTDPGSRCPRRVPVTPVTSWLPRRRPPTPPITRTNVALCVLDPDPDPMSLARITEFFSSFVTTSRWRQISPPRESGG